MRLKCRTRTSPKPTVVPLVWLWGDRGVVGRGAGMDHRSMRCGGSQPMAGCQSRMPLAISESTESSSVSLIRYATCGGRCDPTAACDSACSTGLRGGNSAKVDSQGRRDCGCSAGKVVDSTPETHPQRRAPHLTLLLMLYAGRVPVRLDCHRRDCSRVRREAWTGVGWPSPILPNRHVHRHHKVCTCGSRMVVDMPL